jgi:hypothetical protein
MPDELLTFIETNVFTHRVQALGLEESLQQLQLELLANPEAGDVEPGTGGLRKIRLADPKRGKGKRVGLECSISGFSIAVESICSSSTARMNLRLLRAIKNANCAQSL